MSLKKDLHAILAEARRQGWRVELQRSGHYMLYAPDGRTIVVTGSTPSSPRALVKLVSRMRSLGFR